MADEQKHLKGADYPASGEELASLAERNNAPDELVEQLRRHGVLRSRQGHGRPQAFVRTYRAPDVGDAHHAALAAFRACTTELTDTPSGARPFVCDAAPNLWSGSLARLRPFTLSR